MIAPPLHPEARCAPDPARTLVCIKGADRIKFLQGLVTQDMARVVRDGIGYGALLTPQGKLVADFLIVAQDEAVLLDLAANLAEDVARRLALFRLRAAVEISLSDLPVTRGLGPAPDGALADPRAPGLGWRLYGAVLSQGAPVDWDARHVALGVPQSGTDLIPGDSFILEMGFERLHGVDFRKGCYVGQEVTARMHHKTELRRGLMRVALAGTVAPGTAVLMDDGREAGVIGTVAGRQALALMRLDRTQGPLTAGGVPVLSLADAAQP